ncbi:zinc ribbon domain-containing protein [Eubacteriaceae bacterium ES2]|nr:zinc ribbon domain-containing protein [Eubacteriaceae bacterium ES2]
MAFYKEPCRHCGNLLERDSHFCSKCGSRSPFVDLCPSCLHEIQRDESYCPGCGRSLYISCPNCGEKTFVSDRCEKCDASLMKVCRNRRCGAMQFFENKKCTACGKRME